MNFTESARRLAGCTALLLGWRPDEFWRATPQELADALDALSAPAGEAGTGPMARADLTKLMEASPDE